MKKKHFDDDGKVIDFSKMQQKEKVRANARRRVVLLVTAVIVAVVLLVGAVLYTQFREVTSDKSFWQNFQSSQRP